MEVVVRLRKRSRRRRAGRRGKLQQTKTEMIYRRRKTGSLAVAEKTEISEDARRILGDKRKPEIRPFW